MVGLLLTLVTAALPMPPAMYILQEVPFLQAASPPAGIRIPTEEAVRMLFWSNSTLQVHDSGLPITAVQALMKVGLVLPMPPAMYIWQELQNLQAASLPQGRIRIRTEEELGMLFWSSSTLRVQDNGLPITAVRAGIMDIAVLPMPPVMCILLGLQILQAVSPPAGIRTRSEEVMMLIWSSSTLRVHANGLPITAVRAGIMDIAVLPMPPVMYIWQERQILQAASPPAGIRIPTEEAVRMLIWSNSTLRVHANGLLITVVLLMNLLVLVLPTLPVMYIWQDRHLLQAVSPPAGIRIRMEELMMVFW